MLQVYLSPASQGVEIMTAKSSEMNVVLLSGHDQEPTEHPIPEQFLSRVGADGKLVTTPVSHAG